MNLTEKLVALRKQKGMTQIELAEKLNVSRQAISRWEVGTSVPSMDNLKILSELYEVSLDYLLSDDVEVPSKNNVAQDSENSEQNETEKFQSRKAVIILAAVVVLMVLSVIISVKMVSNQKQEQSTPIGNWTQVEIIDDTPYTFSIE